MEPWRREHHVARVVAGVTRVTVGGVRFRAVAPSREARALACEVYAESLLAAELDGVMTEGEASELLSKLGLWTTQDESEAKTLVRAIEDGKVGLYQNILKSNAVADIRHALSKAREKLGRLEAARHSLDHLTCGGLAAASKVRFLTGASLLHPDGTPYWDDPEDGWLRPDPVVDRVVEALSALRLGDAELREVARNDPWRSLCSAQKSSGAGLFGAASVDLTEDQRGLVLWGLFYDSVRDSPDRPDETVVDDDDMLDGWAVLQRRASEAGRLKAIADKIGNEKVRNSDEVYVPVGSAEDAKKVEEFNAPVARHVKARRKAVLDKEGEVNDVRMPDQMERVREELMKLETKGK